MGSSTSRRNTGCTPFLTIPNADWFNLLVASTSALSDAFADDARRRPRWTTVLTTSTTDSCALIETKCGATLIPSGRIVVQQVFCALNYKRQVSRILGRWSASACPCVEQRGEYGVSMARGFMLTATETSHHLPALDPCRRNLKHRSFGISKTDDPMWAASRGTPQGTRGSWWNAWGRLGGGSVLSPRVSESRPGAPQFPMGGERSAPTIVSCLRFGGEGGRGRGRGRRGCGVEPKPASMSHLG